MAARSWQSDFRFRAIQASIRALRDHQHDPFGFPGSFCIPVGERPVMGWTPGRVSLVAIALGFALLIAGVLLGTLADNNQPAAAGALTIGLAAGCTVAGILTFFVPIKFDRFIICRLLSDRGRQLLERAGTARIMSAELSDPATSLEMSLDGDDHVLIVFDEPNQRLMIEGIGARYQIRAADVERLAPFEVLNYVGVQITCRIDPETRLDIAIARVSLWQSLMMHVPLLFFLRKMTSNKVLENCERTLQ